MSVLENSRACLNLIYWLSVITDLVRVAWKYPISESSQNLTVTGMRKHGAETSIIPPHSFSYMRVLVIIIGEAVCNNSCVVWSPVGFF